MSSPKSSLLGRLSVRVGSYEQNGETKHRYKTLGTVWKSKEGRTYFRIDKTLLSPSLLSVILQNQSKEDRGEDTVLASYFEERDESPRGSSTRAAASGQGQDAEDDEIPF
ncbi:MAG: hypothetical protein KA004_17440 [Verrucomicrobiales bacterium]|nr:hypothetical protein [Verrucomicrobiales bacterium]